MNNAANSLFNIATIKNTTDFKFYSQGKESEFAKCMMENEIRVILERCDSPQGFQMLFDVDNAFAGFSSTILERVNDYVGKSTNLVIGFSAINSDSSSEMQKIHTKRINHGIFLSDLIELELSYFPINLPPSSKMSVEKVVKSVGCGLEALTSPFRLSENPVDLLHVTSMFGKRHPSCFSMAEDPRFCRPSNESSTIWKLFNFSTLAENVDV